MALPAHQPDDLEAAIDREYQRVCSAPTKEEREAAWLDFARLVNSRSPERVAEMERAQRLPTNDHGRRG